MATRNPLNEVTNAINIQALKTMRPAYAFQKECRHLCKEDRTKLYSNCIDCGIFLISSVPAIRDTDAFKVTTSISERMKDMIRHEGINRSYALLVETLKTRTEIVDWICGVGENLGQSLPTVHKAVAYFDTTISRLNISGESQLKLYALSCLQIASKYFELDKKIPKTKELLQAANYAFTSNEIKSAEKIILNILNWSLECVTPIDYIEFFLAQGVAYADDRVVSGTTHKPINKKITDSIRKYSEFFADLCTQDYSYTKHQSIIVAASIIAASRKALKFQKIWCDHLVALTGIEFKNVKICFEQLYGQYYQMTPNLHVAMNNSYAKQITIDNSNIKKETPTQKSKDYSSTGIHSSRYLNDSKMSTADKDSSAKKNAIKINIENPTSVKANLFTTTFKAYLNTSRNNRYELDHKQSHSVNPTGRRTAIKVC